MLCLRLINNRLVSKSWIDRVYMRKIQFKAHFFFSGENK